MKKIFSAVTVSFIAAMLYVPNVHATPIAGDEVIITRDTANGNTSSPGGEFVITENIADNPYSYISFCLEKGKTINLGTTYKLDSSDTTDDGVDNGDGVADFAKNGGTDLNPIVAGKDFLSDATKMIMSSYINNYGTFYDAYKNKGAVANGNEFASLVQDAIWYFEDEINTVSILTTSVVAQFADLDDAKDYNAGFLTNVKVLNLVYTNDTGDKQSQIIADVAGGGGGSGFPAPVPEPATMLLLGTGVASLIGSARSRRKKRKDNSI